MSPYEKRGIAMCFRPAEISMEKNCPQCGAKNDFNNDVCDQCGATLPSAPKIPGGTPGAPAAPGAPKPPAPGAPKPPVA